MRADSLEVMDDIKSKDRQEMESTMNQSVLETAKYPEIAFATTSVSASQLGEGRYQAKLNGNLTLHGVTAGLAIPTQVTLLGDMLRAGGEFRSAAVQFRNRAGQRGRRNSEIER